MKNHTLKSAKSGVKYWWISLIGGLLSIGLGIWCLFAPNATIIALTYIFIIAFFINGVVEIVFSISNRNILPDWGWRLAGGLVDLLLGIILLVIPTAAIITIFMYFIGFWILTRSIGALAEVVDMHQFGMKHWGWILAAVIACVIFSFFFLISPIIFKGAFVVTLVSISFFIYGIFRIYIAFELRALYKDIKSVGKFLKN